MLKQAVRLAQAGFAIHWLHPKSKAPIGAGWSQEPVASAEALEASYRPGNNVGVRLGKWSKVADQYLHAFDLDIRNDDVADEARGKLSELLPEWKSLPTVQSGSGGESRHVYILCEGAYPSKKLAHSDTFTMVWDDKVKKDVKKWDWEIEFFGTGKQVAIPPSIHPDTELPYRWLREFDFDLLEMGLGHFVDKARIEALLNYEPEGDVDPERTKPIGLSLAEIRDYVFDLPLDEWCEDRDGWYRIGMAIHHETGGSQEGFKLFCDWSKQSEKYDLENARERWKSYGKNKTALPFRMASVVAVVNEARLNASIDLLDEEDDLVAGGDEGVMDDDDLLGDAPISKAQQKLNKGEVEHQLGFIDGKIKKLNRKHAIARVKGKTVVLDFLKDGDVSYGSPNDLHAYYENNRVPTQDGKTQPVTKWWMQHKDRREYPHGIVFAPNRDVAGAYNHWQGFSVEPDPKASCRLFLKHLRVVVCRDNPDNYYYLLGWLAHMIQRPEEKPGVAVIFRGKKGTGKDTVGDYVGGLFPHHHVKIANQDQLTGKFNQHQEKCLLLHVEEGFWAGSKGAEGPLKHLITSEDVLIEPKGINPFKVKSVLRLLITSNEKWVVPATADERRYFVLDIGEQHMQDHAYFSAIRKEAANGGRAALLDYLMNYDLTGFDVRNVPATEALAEQKIEGLRNIELWWYGMLENGEIDLGNRGGLGDDSDASRWAWEAVYVDRDEFRGAYARWLHSRRYQGEELRDFEVGKHLRNMLPSIEESRPRVEGQRVRQYRIPDLEKCRQEFEQYLGSELIWPDIDPRPTKAAEKDDLIDDGKDDLLS